MAPSLVSPFDGGASPVGVMNRDRPSYVQAPPIEAVVFAWGTSEDRQLGLDTDQPVMAPKVVEGLLGLQFRGREFQRCALSTAAARERGLLA